jgi:hypothetical protein
MIYYYPYTYLIETNNELINIIFGVRYENESRRSHGWRYG